jgi:hypothetical protein
MPDVRSMLDKEFLYHFDLDGRDVSVCIDRVTPGEVPGENGKKSRKPLVYFKGKNKPLALNITNIRTIAAITGSFDSARWVGAWITLYPTTTQFGPRTVECIRVRPSAPKRGKPAPTEPVQAEGPSSSDTLTREPGADG